MVVAPCEFAGAIGRFIAKSAGDAGYKRQLCLAAASRGALGIIHLVTFVFGRSALGPAKHITVLH